MHFHKDPFCLSIYLPGFPHGQALRVSWFCSPCFKASAALPGVVVSEQKGSFSKGAVWEVSRCPQQRQKFGMGGGTVGDPGVCASITALYQPRVLHINPHPSKAYCCEELKSILKQIFYLFICALATPKAEVHLLFRGSTQYHLP